MSAAPPQRPEGVELLHDGFRAKVQVRRMVRFSEALLWAVWIFALIAMGAAGTAAVGLGADQVATVVGATLVLVMVTALVVTQSGAGRSVEVHRGVLHVQGSQVPLAQLGSRFEPNSGGEVLLLLTSARSWRVVASDDLPDREALRWLQAMLRDATPTGDLGSPGDVPEELATMTRQGRQTE